MFEQIKTKLQQKGFVFFDENKAYNVNLIGIRSKNRCAGQFDDTFILAYRDRNLKQQYFEFPCTTDPSDHYLLSPVSSNGTAIVVAGQYRGVWKLGLHQGKYQALVQRKPIAVYRDNNRDALLNMDARTIETGYFGINLHRAGLQSSPNVGLYSAGCQVIRDIKDYELIMKACQVSEKYYGNSFTYTLLEE